MISKMNLEMSSEEKELLLKDLCARLPYYGLMIYWKGENFNMIDIGFGRVTLLKPFMSMTEGTPLIEEVRPYLRPMSSITEKEISDLQKINWQFNFNKFDNFAYVGAADDGFCSVPDMEKILSYLNAHHFDFRGLIEKGLALEAPEDMYV